MGYYGEPTRYLTFKPDKYVGYLNREAASILVVIATESPPQGPTFGDLVHLTGIGPRHTKAILRYLFGKDYIITNHRIAHLSEKLGIDANKIRGYRP